jgi:hypothetical protein
MEMSVGTSVMETTVRVKGIQTITTQQETADLMPTITGIVWKTRITIMPRVKIQVTTPAILI